MADFQVHVLRKADYAYQQLLADLDHHIGAGAGHRMFDDAVARVKMQFDQGASKINGVTRIRRPAGRRPMYRMFIDGWRVYFKAYVDHEKLRIVCIKPPTTVIP